MHQMNQLDDGEHEILTRQWSARQMVFIQWLANPLEKVPPSQEMLADELGISRSTLKRWRKLPGFPDAVNERAQEMIRDDVPKLLRAGVQHALAGKFEYWKALLQMAGVIAPDKPGGQPDNRTQVIILNGPDTTSRPWYDAAPGPTDGDDGSPTLQRSGLWSALGQNGNGNGAPHTNGHAEE